jgi:uncharacterized protein involved in exopolysaccharide biosynthesis
MMEKNTEHNHQTTESNDGYLAAQESSSVRYYRQPAPYEDDEIDLRELWDAIWAGKWLIIALTSLFALTAVIYALSQPNIYKATALLAPSEQSESGGLSALVGQFGGLASLAGVNLGSGGGDKTTLALEVLKSRQFLTKFINKHQMKVPLLAAKGWSLENNELMIEPDLYDVKSQEWKREVSPPFEREPSDWEIYEVFSGLLNVTTDKETGMVTLSIEYYSPYLAQNWVTLLVQELNEAMKSRDVTQAQKSIAYLEAQLENTDVADMRAVFFELIEEQSKTMMLAEVRDEYVFSTIDPAVVPQQKSKPKRALIAVLGTMLGGMLGVLVVLIRHFSNANKDPN